MSSLDLPAAVADPLPVGTSVTVRQRVFFLLKLLVSAGILVAIVIREDPSRLWDRLSQQNTLYVLAAVALLLLQYPLAAWRWQLVLKSLGAQTSITNLMRLFWIGQFISQIMPTFVAGDGARLWYARRQGMPLRATLSGLMWDRAIGFVGLAIIVLIMTPQVINVVDDRETVLAIRFIALAFVGGYAGATLLGWLIEHRAAAGLWSTRFRDLMADCWHIARNAKDFAFVLSAATCTNILIVLAAWLLARGSGIDLHLWDAMALVPVGLFATLLPISVAGWGVREASLSYFLAYVGLGSVDAVSVSVMLGICLMLATLPGAYYLIIDGAPRRFDAAEDT